MLFSLRWCPVDDLTASTFPELSFYIFKVTDIVSLNLQCPKWLFQAQTLTSDPSQLLAPAVFTIWSEDFSQPRQVLWAGIINLIQFQTFPHPTHSSKLKPSLLIPNSIFFNAVSPWHPIQFQPCWSTFPELSFNIEEHRRRFVLISTIPMTIAVDC